MYKKYCGGYRIKGIYKGDVSYLQILLTLYTENLPRALPRGHQAAISFVGVYHIK